MPVGCMEPCTVPGMLPHGAIMPGWPPGPCGGCWGGCWGFGCGGCWLCCWIWRCLMKAAISWGCVLSICRTSDCWCWLDGFFKVCRSCCRAWVAFLCGCVPGCPGCPGWPGCPGGPMTGGGPGAPLCWATWLGWAIMPGLMPPAWPCWGCPGMPPGLGYLQRKNSGQWGLI